MVSKKVSRILGLAMALIAVACSASAAPKKLPSYLAGPRPERGSFLNHPARNLKEVILQVQGDPVTADRLMRHFQMSKPNLVAYLRTLHMAQLKEDGVYFVFNVHEDGVIRERIFNLPKGTWVYADALGTPILRHLCANPMTRGPKRGVAPQTFGTVGDEQGFSQLAVPVASQEVVAMIDPSMPEDPAPLTEPEMPQPPEKPLEHIKLPEVALPSTGGSGAVFQVLGLGSIVTVGAIASLGGDDGNPPVPEPASFLAFGVPLAYLAARRIKKAGRRSR